MNQIKMFIGPRQRVKVQRYGRQVTKKKNTGKEETMINLL